MSERRLGVIYGLGAYLVWGFLTVYWKALESLDSFELIGLRVMASVLLLLVVLAVRRAWSSLSEVRGNGRLALRLVAAAALLTANWTTYVWSVSHGHVLETALGYFLAPLITCWLGVRHLGEHLRRAQFWALVLGAVAVGVLVVGYGKVPWVAIVLGASWAVYGLLKKQMPLDPVAGLTAETLVVLPFALAVVALHEIMAPDTAALRQASGGQLALLGLAGLVTVVPLVAFAAAARRVPLTTLGPLQYAVPTINMLLGVAAYHEDLPGWRLAGFALVWVALLILTADALHAARPAVRRRDAEAMLLGATEPI